MVDVVPRLNFSERLRRQLQLTVEKTPSSVQISRRARRSHYGTLQNFIEGSENCTGRDLETSLRMTEKDFFEFLDQKTKDFECQLLSAFEGVTRFFQRWSAMPPHVRKSSAHERKLHLEIENKLSSALIVHIQEQLAPLIKEGTERYRALVKEKTAQMIKHTDEAFHRKLQFMNHESARNLTKARGAFNVELMNLRGTVKQLEEKLEEAMNKLKTVGDVDKLKDALESSEASLDYAHTYTNDLRKELEDSKLRNTILQSNFQQYTQEKIAAEVVRLEEQYNERFSRMKDTHANTVQSLKDQHEKQIHHLQQKVQEMRDCSVAVASSGQKYTRPKTAHARMGVTVNSGVIGGLHENADFLQAAHKAGRGRKKKISCLHTTEQKWSSPYNRLRKTVDLRGEIETKREGRYEENPTSNGKRNNRTFSPDEQRLEKRTWKQLAGSASLFHGAEVLEYRCQSLEPDMQSIKALRSGDVVMLASPSGMHDNHDDDDDRTALRSPPSALATVVLAAKRPPKLTHGKGGEDGDTQKRKERRGEVWCSIKVDNGKGAKETRVEISLRERYGGISIQGARFFVSRRKRTETSTKRLSMLQALSPCRDPSQGLLLRLANTSKKMEMDKVYGSRLLRSSPATHLGAREWRDTDNVAGRWQQRLTSNDDDDDDDDDDDNAASRDLCSMESKKEIKEGERVNSQRDVPKRTLPWQRADTCSSSPSHTVDPALTKERQRELQITTLYPQLCTTGTGESYHRDLTVIDVRPLSQPGPFRYRHRRHRRPRSALILPPRGQPSPSSPSSLKIPQQNLIVTRGRNYSSIVTNNGDPEDSSTWKAMKNDTRGRQQRPKAALSGSSSMSDLPGKQKEGLTTTPSSYRKRFSQQKNSKNMARGESRRSLSKTMNPRELTRRPRRTRGMGSGALGVSPWD